MFDTPVDGWYAWVGVAAASAVLVGTAVGLPTTPPPDAASVADVVDRTAATEYGAYAEHPLDASEVRLTPRGVALRSDAGAVTAAFVYGPVTPVGSDDDLRAVLRGVPPERRFSSTDELRQAAEQAQANESRWRRVDGPLTVRHVVGEGYDVTLVGA